MEDILIVDDERAIRFAMRAFFAKRAYAVECAADREEAETLLARRRFALVIADLRLPPRFEREGLDLLALLRRESPRTRFVLLTAYGSPEIEAEARRQGADAFLHKPQRLGAIEGIVAQLVGRTS
jgi:DNA-binding NtrC family response regulator